MLMDSTFPVSYLYVSMSVHWPQGIAPSFLLMRQRWRPRQMRLGGGRAENEKIHFYIDLFDIVITANS